MPPVNSPIRQQLRPSFNGALLSALLLLVGCVTASEARLDDLSDQNQTKLESAHSTLSCDKDSFDDQCKQAQDDVPTQCFASQTKKRLILTTQGPKGWGNNECYARADFVRRACAAGFDLSGIQDVYCAPDPSEGRCPVEPTRCPADDRQGPILCIAHEYAGFPLEPSTIVGAWGNSECEARNNLNIAACQGNLKPAELGAVKCELAYHPEACPPEPPRCDIDSEPTWCTAPITGSPGLAAQTLRVYGRNECEARYEFQRKYCMLGYRSDRSNNWSCSSGG